MAPNQNLTKARKAKNDEFYTRLVDIELEVAAYLAADPDVFRDKTVLLPCDDPSWSNFTQFFARNFTRLGLRRLISTCFVAGGTGKLFVHSVGDADIDPDALAWVPLTGDGDFRSPEVTALRDEADLIITNPPFSLFRELLAWVTEADKQFLLLGNLNAITYKEVFPLIQSGELHIGATNFNTGMYFSVPDGFTYAETYKFEREIDGERVARVPAVCWFTNIAHANRPAPLTLLTAAGNKAAKGVVYQRYDDHDAIEVPKVAAIPSDHTGVMGVPITFAGKHNPGQFEIVGLARFKLGGATTYQRILIRHRVPAVA